MTGFASALALLAALAASAALRIAYIVRSSRSGVDHFYWILAARAYRAGGALPVRVPGKYLLEDERQAYPPFFGWLLGRLPERCIAGPRAVSIVQAADLAALGLLVALAASRGTPLSAIAAIVAVYGTAPLLAAYNTQLASRAFGNLFYVATVCAMVLASGTASSVLHAALLAAAVAGAAAVVLAHKMTTQLMFVLWPLWPAALEDLWVLAVPPGGVLLAALVTGPRFALLQWRAHADIVSFWHRNRDFLLAHAFRHSPIYGNPDRRDETCYHKRGWRGVRSHLALALGYLPLLWLAPLTLLWAPLPSAWIALWALGTGAWALATLFVPALRCLGGGHLYLYNAAAPAALWWGELFAAPTGATGLAFVLGLLATLAALAVGLRRKQRSSRDEGYREALAFLATLPKSAVAVFPLNAAEEVAYRTPHAVLWGAHGYGFRRLEDLFPVLRRKLSDLMREHGCRLLLYDTSYWPDGPQVLAREFPGARCRRFGSWELLQLPDAPQEPDRPPGESARPAEAASGQKRPA